MMIDEKPVDRQISLHGLGFVQVQLTEDWRLHVWHPDLPRRACFEDSQIHNHSFDFQSMVLAGAMKQTVHCISNSSKDRGQRILEAYKHDGQRTDKGNRPWLKQPGFYEVLEGYSRSNVVEAGQLYRARGQDFHVSEPLGDGRVATLMAKTKRLYEPAYTLVAADVQPDVDFDRFQWPEEALWTAVVDVLRHGKGNLMPSLGYLTGGRYR